MKRWPDIEAEIRASVPATCPKLPLVLLQAEFVWCAQNAKLNGNKEAELIYGANAARVAEMIIEFHGDGAQREFSLEALAMR